MWTFDKALLTEKPTSEALEYGTRCQWITLFYLHTYSFIHELNEPYLPLSSLPKLAGPHLPTTEGWKAEYTQTITILVIIVLN